VQKEDGIARKTKNQNNWEGTLEKTALLVGKPMNVKQNFTVAKSSYRAHYVKPKHLSTTGGKGAKFLCGSKAEAENILKAAILNGKIIDILDNGLTPAGNQSYEYIIDAGKVIGTKGEYLIKIVLSIDGGMLSAYPVK